MTNQDTTTPELAALVALRAEHLATEDARAAAAAEAREAEREELVAAVRAAHAAGTSATRIAQALGISRQRLYALAGPAFTTDRHTPGGE
jgi:DNA-binding phage protein